MVGGGVTLRLSGIIVFLYLRMYLVPLNDK